MLVEGGPVEGTGDAAAASSAVEGDSDEGGSSKGSQLGHSAQSRHLQEVLGKSGGQEAGQGAELVAAELEQALQVRAGPGCGALGVARASAGGC